MAPRDLNRGAACVLIALAIGCGGNRSSNRGGTTVAPTTTAPTTSSTTGTPTSSAPPLSPTGVIVEDFQSLAAVDSAQTTASWGQVVSATLVATNAEFGGGARGAFAPATDITLTTANGPYEFRSVHIRAGVTVKATGPNPLVIRCQGEFVLDGTLDVSGQDGEHAHRTVTPKGGLGGPGGGKGGDGADTTAVLPERGGGPGGGDNTGATGAGAGHAFAGNGGAYRYNTQPTGGGAAYGNQQIDPVLGGSGGSGGAPSSTRGTVVRGPGGGGGGGAVHILAGGDVVLRGRIDADGGEGGGYARTTTAAAQGAGGGSGGAVLVQSGQRVRFEGGLITARGGHGGNGDLLGGILDSAKTGGNGSPGRVRVADQDGVIEHLATHIYPQPHFRRAAQTYPGGNGTDGAFSATPGTPIHLDTTNGPFHFTSFVIPAGATVTASGPYPLEVFSTGDIVIEGTLDVSGQEGGTSLPGGSPPPLGGAAGPAGFAGGRAGSEVGATTVVQAEAGAGPGGGARHPRQAAGSGGGHGTPGQMGNAITATTGPAPGATYGAADLSTLQGGSGGAGADSARSNGSQTGNAGGGGGGAVRLQAKGNLIIRGSVLADGGDGGGKPAGGVAAQTLVNTLNLNAILPMLDVAGGGGGAGGAILLQGQTVDVGGARISARGGQGGQGLRSSASVVSPRGEQSYNFYGGSGGDGRISLQPVQAGAGGVDLRSYQGHFADLLPWFVEGQATADAYRPTQPYGLTARSSWHRVPAHARFKPAVVQGQGLGKVLVQFEGADDDGQGRADPATSSGWVDDLTQLSGRAHVRFRVVLTPEARVERVELPYGP